MLTMLRARLFGMLASCCVLSVLTLLGACASNPPPPPAEPPSAPAPTPSITENMPPSSVDAGAPVADAPPQAQVECQGAEDCKAKGQPGSGSQWACENGHCMEQAVAEPPKADENASAAKDEKSSKPGKKKGKKK